MKKVILIILDGYGISESQEGNPIKLVKPQNLNYLKENYPYCQLSASGEAVGLPIGEPGNSETGHMNLGAGKVVLQNLLKINKSIDNNSFFENQILKKTIVHVNEYQSNIHLMGLIGNGNVHSSLKHLYALLKFYKQNSLKQVYLHLFTDGRDSPPKSALETIKQITQEIENIGIGKIVSIMGRYYAMDRDFRWQRTEKAYKCLTEGSDNIKISAEEAIQQSYDKRILDEFIEPVNIKDETNNIHLIKNNDAVVFINFRIDRPRQLTKAFVLENFEKTANEISSFKPEQIPFQRKIKLTNLYFVTMTQYQKGLSVNIAFPSFPLTSTVGEIISKNNLRQLRLTESEKERMVTYYFNGQNENPYNNEFRIIIPSPKVATYDKKPEMSAFEITNALIEEIKTQKNNFILVNFANTDMVGHTGIMDACKIAIKTIDECIEKIVKESLQNNYSLLITADHGNIEQKINPQTKLVSTQHTSNPVPFFFIDNDFKNKTLNIKDCKLADVGTTILHLLGLEIPDEMNGKNLLG
ncbi:MAG: 2,3-bisphosphoglycerate-independent phosphoglycerate mutase [bacterium]